MATIEANIIINHPIEEIFDFVTDVNNAARWQSGIIAAKAISNGSIGVGTTYQYIVQVMGRKIETQGEITAYEPHVRYAWKSTKGPFPLSGGTAFEPTPKEVRVTDTVDVEPGGFFKLAEPVIANQQQSQMEKDLAKLKQVLEE
ncbi:MAG: SRPBCC family protein [Anaerolineales bacterium]|nr:SRPBCC family protein [Chloroflexota bacterium]MBL6979590.1 SRPBCC family protein [Anaerolineales bacterium]